MLKAGSLTSFTRSIFSQPVLQSPATERVAPIFRPEYELPMNSQRILRECLAYEAKLRVNRKEINIFIYANEKRIDFC